MANMIVAMTKDKVIAVDGKIPWHYLEDLKRFRELTMGHTIIMGHNTFASLNYKPLPGRNNIVISRQKFPGIQTFRWSTDAIYEYKKREENFWVIGGGRIYEETLQFMDYIDITIVPNEYSQVNGRLTFFPHLSWIPEGCKVHTTYLGCEDSMHGTDVDARGIPNELL